MENQTYKDAKFIIIVHQQIMIQREMIFDTSAVESVIEEVLKVNKDEL